MVREGCGRSGDVLLAALLALTFTHSGWYCGLPHALWARLPDLCSEAMLHQIMGCRGLPARASTGRPGSYAPEPLDRWVPAGGTRDRVGNAQLGGAWRVCAFAGAPDMPIFVAGPARLQ